MSASARLFLGAWLLAGCPYLGDARYRDDIQDHDGDGVIATRFGGDDCRDDDPGIERCDADGDGADAIGAGGDDCDDEDAAVWPGADERCNGADDDCDGRVDDDDDDVVEAPSWYADDDGDGYGAAAEVAVACLAPAFHVADDRDCDDDRADVRPGAVEFCDDTDRDCNGDPTLNAVDPVDWYADDDGDGFGAGPQVTLACDGPAGTSINDLDCDDAQAGAFPGAIESWYDGVDADCDGADDFDQDGDGLARIPEGGDCDDLDADRFPGAVEVCNGGVDDDCDGVADSDDPSVDTAWTWTYFLDADGDGFGDTATARAWCPNTAPAGWVVLSGDCDDALDASRPGGTEVCDARDNDCDGVVDDGAIGMVDYFLDGDGDGFGGPTTQAACELGPGLAAIGGDCNDADAQTWPGAPEVCGDLFRQDCSGLSASDCDSDGFPDLASGGTDCDDTTAAVSPIASEICDGLDNDCDLLIDSGDPSVDLSTAADWYFDDDGDGFGGPFLMLPSACAPIPGAAPNATDCDDDDPDAFPGALEACDGDDDDCDGSVDEGPIADPPAYHYDADADGFGNPDLVWAQGCTPPSTSWVLDDTDCHDGYAARNPLALEVCDGLDNDCDLLVDTDDPSAAVSLWYRDDDGDGYGQTGVVLAQCGQPAGHAALSDDCNDFAAATNPGATEVCDAGVDNDCDGLGDDADPDLIAAVTWHPDADNDGFGDPAQSLVQCGVVPGWVTNDADCDDGQASISPAAIELCDGDDNDCDGATDDADPGVIGAAYWFPDGDGDAWGDLLAGVRACVQPPGLLPQGGDCDDADGSVFPGAPEVCNGTDDDCDLLVDDLDPSVDPRAWYADLDGDGAGDPLDTTFGCAFPGAGWSATPDDCDDASAAVGPGAVELCNFYDDDCDGRVDDDDSGVVAPPTWYDDADGDGFGDPAVATVGCQAPPGFVFNPADCDDTEPQANPSQTLEWCNGFDDDCNGLVDELDPAVIDADNWYLDVDGDGEGDMADPGTTLCAPLAGYASSPSDCDDGNPDVFPGAVELCANGVDDDCNGLDGPDDPGVSDALRAWWDADGDGFGDPATETSRCTGGGGWVLNGTDCADTDPTIRPGVSEVCDGADNDCDGTVDAGATDAVPWYADADGDGFGDVSVAVPACAPPSGYGPDATDCDDLDPARNPGAAEVCDGADNDCDPLVDDADPDLAGAPLWYPDADVDGAGDDSLVVGACLAPFGTVATGGDCDDHDPGRRPLADELCDGLENDCDGLTDEDDPSLVGAVALYADDDGDGFGGAFARAGCLGPADVSALPGDCDDGRGDVNPLALERCGGGDEDCDGLVDELDGSLTDPRIWHLDNDGDGDGAPLGVVVACEAPPMYVEDASDCDDFDPDVWTGAVERCDGADDDCDGLVDDADPELVGPSWFLDADGDGWGDASNYVTACLPPPGVVVLPGDCDDGDADLFPGQTLVVGAVGPRFDTIQGAIAAACTNGTIRVLPGTYPEQLDLLGKRLVVRASQPLEPPVLTAPVTPAILLDSGEPSGTAFEDFVVRSVADGGGPGGGARIANGARVAFRGVRFEGHAIAGDGGAVSVADGAATFESCSFVANTAGSGGAIHAERSSVWVLGGQLELNTATIGDGGGIRAVDTDLVVAQAWLDQNASTFSAGGALALVGGTAALTDVELSQNTAPLGGSIHGLDVGTLDLAYVAITDAGGGVYLEAVGPSVVTVDHLDAVGVNQSVIEAFGSGIDLDLRYGLLLGAGNHGVWTTDAAVSVAHTTIAGCVGRGLLFTGGSGSVTHTALSYNQGSDLIAGAWSGTVDHTLFTSPVDAATWGASNVSGNPGFVTFHAAMDPLRWDVHLRPTSPALDAGDPGLLDTDGSTADLGFHGGPEADASWYDDLDADGFPDGWELDRLGDLSRSGPEDDDGDGWNLTTEYTAGTWPNLADTDGDGAPDGSDLFALDPGIQ